MKNYILIFIGVFTLTFNVKAQSGIEKILLAGIEDANKISNAYLNPVMKGFIYGMNNGWYHTAKVHKTLGFDITIGLNAALIPTKDEVFAFSNLGLENLTPTLATSPTLFGNSTLSSNTVDVTIPANTFDDINNGVHPELTSTFKMPDGFKDDLPINAIPTPTIQVGVGLPYDSEVIVRYLPKTEIDDLETGMFGLGLKKEITSWFGPLDKLPLHVSLLGTYSNMNLDYDIQKNNIAAGSGQRAEFKLRTYSFDIISSLNFPFINIYGGVGYAGGSINTSLLGSYKLEYTESISNTKITRTLTNPLSLKSNVSGVRANIGARLSLGFFKIFGSYTLQEYNTANLGIAISIR